MEARGKKKLGSVLCCGNIRARFRSSVISQFSGKRKNARTYWETSEGMLARMKDLQYAKAST